MKRALAKHAKLAKLEGKEMASRADVEIEERRLETTAAPPRDNPTEVSLQMTLAKPAKLAKEDKQDQIMDMQSPARTLAAARYRTKS